MSPGSVQLVRTWWDAVCAGDHETLVPACDPAVAWDLTQLEGWAGEGVARGHDGVRAVLSTARWTEGGTCVASGDRVLIDAHDDATAAVVHELEGGRIRSLASITDLWDAQLALTGDDPVAIVRAVWETWEARDMDRVMAAFADDVVFDLGQYGAWRGEPRYDGPTSIISFLAEWMAWWHGYHQEALDYEQHGRDVLLSVRHGGDRDGEHVEETGGLLYGVGPNGKIDRWTVFPSPTAARAWMQLRKAPAEAQ
jgi:ketosteroid isomerase-like protein